MRPPQLISFSLMLVVLASCTTSGRGVRTVGEGMKNEVMPRLPTLERVATVPAPEGAVVAGPLAVGPAGEVLLPISGEGDDPRLVLLDSLGKPIVRFGRTGSGPGEVRSPMGLWIGEDDIRVFDGSALRISAFNQRGDSRWQWQLSGMIIPFDVVGDTAWAIQFSPEGTLEYSKVIRNEGSLKLLAPNDSAVASLMPAEGQPAPLARVMTNHGLVLGDPKTFTLLWIEDGETGASVRVPFTAPVPSAAAIAEHRVQWQRFRGPDGRPLSAADINARMEAWLATPRLPFAHPYGLGADGRGRVWVWMDQGAEVTVEILSNGHDLGRLSVDCPGAGRAWDVAGGRLVALCERPDASLELRYWRIVEQAEASGLDEARPPSS